MARSKDYVPANDNDFNLWFKNLNQYVGGKVSGSNPEWKHIPKEDSDGLNAAYLDWYTFYAPMLKPSTKADTVEKDKARKRAEKVIRPFVKQYLHFRPVTDGDRVNMGLPVYEETRTNHIEVKEIVEYMLKLRNIREIVVHFWVKGAANRAKPDGYEGALIIWDVLDKPPSRPEDLKRHTVASKTPYALRFDETERGKTMYICAAWQNRRSNVGQWSEIQSAIVP
jgi:hypothetical protein